MGSLFIFSILSAGVAERECDSGVVRMLRMHGDLSSIYTNTTQPTNTFSPGVVNLSLISFDACTFGVVV